MPEWSSDEKLGTAAVAGFRREEARALELHEQTEQQRGALVELHAWAASFTPEPPTRPSIPSSTALGPRLFAAERRSNNVACIDAGRGLGKTSVLVTFLSELRTSLEKAQAMGKPALVPLRTTDFDAITREVSVALALLEPLFSVAATVRAQSLSPDASPWVAASSPWDSREPKSAIAERNLQHALAHWFAGVNATSHAKTREEIVGLVREVDGNPLHVQRAFQEYVDQLACDLHEMPGGPRNPVFVASIDDADLSPERIADLLAALRIFTHERVAWVVSADLRRMRADLARVNAKKVSAPKNLAKQAVQKVFGKVVRLGRLSAADIATVVRGSTRLRAEVRSVLESDSSWAACLPDRLRHLVDVLSALTEENLVSELAVVFRDAAGQKTTESWKEVIDVLADRTDPADAARWWEDLERVGVDTTARLGSSVAAEFPAWAGSKPAVYTSAAVRPTGTTSGTMNGGGVFFEGARLPRAIEQLAAEVLERACRENGRAAVRAVERALQRAPLVDYGFEGSTPPQFRDSWIIQASSPAECQNFAARWADAVGDGGRHGARALSLADLVMAYVSACGADGGDAPRAISDAALVRARELLHPVFGVPTDHALRISASLPAPRSTRAAVDRVLSIEAVVSGARESWVDERIRDLGAQRCGLPEHWDDGYRRALRSLLGRCLWPTAVGRRASLADYVVHPLALPNGGEQPGDGLHQVAVPLGRALIAVEERGPKRGHQRAWQIDPAGAWQALRAILQRGPARDALDIVAGSRWKPVVVPQETIAEQASDGSLRYYEPRPLRRSSGPTQFGRREFLDPVSLLRTADADWGAGMVRNDPKNRAVVGPEGWHERLRSLVSSGPPRIQVVAVFLGRRVALPFSPDLDAGDEALLAQQLHALGVSTRQVSTGHTPAGLWSAYLCCAWGAVLEVLDDARLPKDRNLSVPAAHALGTIGNFARPTFTYRNAFTEANKRIATWLHAAPLLLLPEFGLTPAVAEAWVAGGMTRDAQESGLRAAHYRDVARVFRRRTRVKGATPPANHPWTTFLAQLGDS